ncbi:MAG: hypothetical protein ACK55I_19015, partial [bacterium]
VVDKAIPQGVAFVGELGLTGEVRRVAYLEQRLSEAGRLGLDGVYAAPDKSVSSRILRGTDRLSGVISELFR